MFELRKDNMGPWNITLKNIPTRIWLALRLCISVALYYSGLLNIYRGWKKRRVPASISILAYHDISEKSYLGLQVPERVFNIHMKYLRESNYRIISLEDAVGLMSSGDDIPADCVVVTFDDGYMSMYTNVYPIVKRNNIPITIFVSTNPVDNKTPLFVDRLACALSATGKEQLNLTSLGMGVYPISSERSKEHVCQQIIACCKRLSADEREKLLGFVIKELDVSEASRGMNEKAKGMTLTWEKIAEMSDNGISFGAHTVSHPCLSAISIDEARMEIEKSGQKIAEKIGKKTVAFAYPFGSASDVSIKVRDAVAKAGYSCACLLKNGINLKGDDLFLLKRRNITSHIVSGRLTPFARADFAVQLSGILDRGVKKPSSSRASRDKKINILYIIDQLSGMAGTERHLLYLVNRLNRDRFNCYVCCFNGDEDGMVGKIRQLGITVIDLNLNRIYSPMAPIKALEIRKIIKNNNIDIVQTFHFKSDTFGVFTSHFSGISKIISSRRDMGDLKTERQRFLNKLMNRYINRYIMVCDRVGGKFHQSENIPLQSMATIYNGVDFEIFNSRKKTIKTRKDVGLDANDFVIGSTAIFRPEKSYHVLFEAIEMLMPKIKNIKAVVIGQGPMQEYYTNYCNNGPLKDVVKIVGRVEDVENYLPLFNVFCLVPSKNEGFSNAIIEAMAMGRVVVATDVGGNGESVVNEETGFVIPPDNPEKLAERLMYLYENPKVLRKMGIKSRARAEEAFSLDAMIRRHEEFYEDVYRLA